MTRDRLDKDHFKRVQKTYQMQEVGQKFGQNLDFPYNHGYQRDTQRDQFIMHRAHV